MITATQSRHTNVRPARPRVAVALATGLLSVAAFQAALASGAPFGVAAFGGANSGQLPHELRLVAGAATALWLFAALMVLDRGGISLVRLQRTVARVGTRVLAALLALGACMNFASSSPWERFGWGPFTLVLFILCLVLSRSASA